MAERLNALAWKASWPFKRGLGGSNPPASVVTQTYFA